MKTHSDWLSSWGKIESNLQLSICPHWAFIEICHFTYFELQCNPVRPFLLSPQLSFITYVPCFSDMSGNSSLFSNESVISSSSSNMKCFFMTPSSSVFSGYYLVLVSAVLPLSVLILCRGFQQWKQTSPSSTVSHSDHFTFHLAAMELIGISGSICCCWGIYKSDVNMVKTGDYLWCFSWFGETLFQMLTCLEHYLAVVHPITYQSSRKGRGIKIRNNVIAAVWLLCVVGTCCMLSGFLIVNVVIWMVFLSVGFFCNFSVMFFLIRPGPGEKSGLEKKPDHRKRRAFMVIVSIPMVLLLRCAINMVWFALPQSDSNRYCLVSACTMFLTLPGSLTLPLLFLHKAVKRRKNAK